MGVAPVPAAGPSRDVRNSFRGHDAPLPRPGGAAPAALGRLSCHPRTDRILDRPAPSPSRATPVHARRRRMARRPSLPMNETGISPAERATLTTRAALASIAMAVTLIALKSYAALETSSMAMLG